MALTIEERKAVATMARLADALKEFAELTRSQGATRRVYDQALLMNEDYIADYINKRQAEVGAVVTIDHIEKIATNTMRRVVYHYDKQK